MAEKIESSVDDNQQEKNTNKLVSNSVNPEAMEAKEDREKAEIKEEVEDLPKAPVTGADRVNESILMMTKVEVKPSYNIDYTKKYMQFKKMCEYQPFVKIRPAKEADGKSIFWVAIGESEKIKLPLKANSGSFLSLLRYIQGGVLDSEVDFNNCDFDNLEEDWEVLYLEQLCNHDSDLKVDGFANNNAYISYRAKFGCLTFKIKEEGKGKYILTQILSK